jgi:pseudolysin
MRYPLTHEVLLMTGLTVGMSMLHAAEPWSLSQVSLSELKKAFYVTSPMIQSTDTTPKILPRNTLQSYAEQHDEQMTHTRLQQMYAGFPVWGGTAIFHRQINMTTSAHPDVRMNGQVYRALEEELGDPSPDFSDRATVALQAFSQQYTEGLLSEAQATPLIYVDEENKPHWAYRVTALVERPNAIPKRPTAIVDATSFQAFLEWDDIKTLKFAVKGQGYGGNEKISQWHYGPNQSFLMLMRDASSGRCTLENQWVSVIDMKSKTTGAGQLSAFSCGTLAESYWTGLEHDGYDRINGAYSPSNDALYIGGIIHEMYANWYGVEALGTLLNPKQLKMRVHYGEGFENAYWDGRQMTFGDGGEEMYPLTVLSVGAHEVSHGFTEQYSDLAYVGQSGGLNESFSDIAAQAIDYYKNSKNNWMIGLEIMKKNSGSTALRYMDTPRKDGKSIERADQYTKGMNVHYSSGVYNRFFYLLATQPGWTTRQAFHVMLNANMNYWTPTSTFESAACGVLSAADDLKLPLEPVKQAFQAVAIDTSHCDR